MASMTLQAGCLGVHGSGGLIEGDVTLRPMLSEIFCRSRLTRREVSETDLVSAA